MGKNWKKKFFADLRFWRRPYHQREGLGLTQVAVRDLDGVVARVGQGKLVHAEHRARVGGLHVVLDVEVGHVTS